MLPLYYNPAKKPSIHGLLVGPTIGCWSHLHMANEMTGLPDKHLNVCFSHNPLDSFVFCVTPFLGRIPIDSFLWLLYVLFLGLLNKHQISRKLKCWVNILPLLFSEMSGPGWDHLARVSAQVSLNNETNDFYKKRKSQNSVKITNFVIMHFIWLD